MAYLLPLENLVHVERMTRKYAQGHNSLYSLKVGKRNSIVIHAWQHSSGGLGKSMIANM